MPYPGTPSTEILEYLVRYQRKNGGPRATWSTNEKTAYEEALGVSFAGRRALTSMKHVGLNVAADPFMNSAIVSINGGLVVVVADDPGMHSSQNEQDTRYYADFARIVLLEPANQQEAYDMTRDAFDLSERFTIPVLVRLVTRLAHSRAVVRVRQPRPENAVAKAPVPASWILLPANAREQWRQLLRRQPQFLEWSEACSYSRLRLNDERRDLGVITTGIARNYYVENLDELGYQPSHLHIGAYPAPIEQIRRLMGHVSRVLVLEEGYPFVERMLRGVVPPDVEVMGKESGALPPDGELTPDIVRRALGLRERRGVDVPGLSMPSRPPQLCAGCPHADSFDAIKQAIADIGSAVVTSDIGCYTLGALPPYSAVESCVCMGASIGHGEGGVGRRPEADDRGHRRQHLPALRRDAAHGRGRREHGHDARHPGQRDDGHDGRAADDPAAVADREARARPRRGPGALPRRHRSPPPHRAEPRVDPPRGRVSRPVGHHRGPGVHRDAQGEEEGSSRRRAAVSGPATRVPV